METISVRNALLATVVLTSVVFAVLWARNARRTRVAGASERIRPTRIELAIGFVTNFFDTLGIGSYATTTTAYKTLDVVPDENIPGTMLIGHSLPVAAQALIFIASVNVETTVLLALIAATMIGGWLGAGVVTRLPRRPIQIGMGTGLLIAASIMVMSQLGVIPGGGTALGLTGGKLVFACAVSFLLGAILMIGIGNYAPTLILLSLLGMDPRAAFPIMMGAGALVGMVGGIRFINRARYNLRAALGLTLGGIPAVLLAGLVVKSLPLGVLRWVVVGVVTYAAVMMLRSASYEKLSGRPGAPPSSSSL